jgi:solute carrier family 25 S-adenosylmethionine transporter 26
MSLYSRLTPSRPAFRCMLCPTMPHFLAQGYRHVHPCSQESSPIIPLNSGWCSVQDPRGFVKAGGFKGVYNGLASAAAGSAPGAALFFSSYETVKNALTKRVDEKLLPTPPACTASARPGFQCALIHSRSNVAEAKAACNARRYHSACYMTASSCGEVAACLVRVPTENIKQKMQAGQYNTTMECIRGVAKDGPAGFYRGYFTTVAREIPFSFIQVCSRKFPK